MATSYMGTRSFEYSAVTFVRRLNHYLDVDLLDYLAAENLVGVLHVGQVQFGEHG